MHSPKRKDSVNFFFCHGTAPKIEKKHERLWENPLKSENVAATDILVTQFLQNVDSWAMGSTEKI